MIKQGAWEKESSTFWQVLEEYPWHSGSEPIRIALKLHEIERAWEYAQRWGAGWSWEELALAKPRLHPDLSLELYFASLDEDFTTTGAKGARKVIAKLQAMRTFIAEFDEREAVTAQRSVPPGSQAEHEAEQPVSKAQLEAQFEGYIAQVRRERANRPHAHGSSQESRILTASLQTMKPSRGYETNTDHGQLKSMEKRHFSALRTLEKCQKYGIIYMENVQICR